MKINIESETVAQLFSYGSSLVFGISLVLMALTVTLALMSQKTVRAKQPSHLNQDDGLASGQKADGNEKIGIAINSNSATKLILKEENTNEQ